MRLVKHDARRTAPRQSLQGGCSTLSVGSTGFAARFSVAPRTRCQLSIKAKGSLRAHNRPTHVQCELCLWVWSAQWRTKRKPREAHQLAWPVHAQSSLHPPTLTPHLIPYSSIIVWLWPTSCPQPQPQAMGKNTLLMCQMLQYRKQPGHRAAEALLVCTASRSVYWLAFRPRCFQAHA